MKYRLVVCGGTFDHFHKGHKEFLRYGLSIASKLLVGLTTDRYAVNKNNSENIEDYKTRKKTLEDFFIKEKYQERVSILPIDDIFIPRIWEDLPIEAIIVSKNTISAANKINLIRKEQGKYPLKTEIVPLVKGDKNEYISSSKIRSGEINREGKSCLNPTWLHKTLFITEDVRQYVRKPFGTVLRNNVILAKEVRPESPTMIRHARQAVRRPDLNAEWPSMTHPYIITVGDVTTKTFNDLSLNQHISIIDFKVARKRKFSDFRELGFSGEEKIFRVSNPSGCLTPDLFKIVVKIFTFKNFQGRIILKIEGEEDLAVLPVILIAPLGTTIFYGQPEKGVVKVYVSERTKEQAYRYARMFTVI